MFDNFELQLVGEWSADESCGETFCEPMDSPEDPQRHPVFIKMFWTIYGHLPEGYAMALIDVGYHRKEEALKICNFFQELLTYKKSPEDWVDENPVKALDLVCRKMRKEGMEGLANVMYAVKESSSFKKKVLKQ